MDQYVQRRQNHPLISFPKAGARTAHKPYKYIDGVKQNPAPVKRSRRKQGPGRFPAFQLPPFHLFKDGGVAKENTAVADPAQQAPKKPFWETSIPVCVLVGIAVFSALILGLQDTPVMALSPGEDPGIALRVNLAAYAETGVSGAQGSVSEAALPDPDVPIPLDLMETFQWETYRVARGDSVSKIALDHSVSMDAIIASNGITNARRLREGETIRIPNMDGIPYTVKRGDTISRISTALGAPVEAILDANDLESDTLSAGQSLFIPGARMAKEDLKLALGELFIYPIRGRLTSPYGWRNDPISGVRRYHAALDLAAPTGTPVKAAMDGRVATVGYNGNYGNYIIISHSRGFQTLYGHLSAVSVKQGAYVYQGGKIGAVGSTGYSTGPHLHFAVYKNGKAVSPLEYLTR
ncbi:hypothetical protein AGMMS49942_16690 [Spirochaetia bacterium]|nr:hypothetical protein AGMMS49942_16690 [Spirochaetia bacterium]